VAGPLYQIDLSISQGADEPYGPFGFGDRETVDPFAQYQLLVYRNFAGWSAAWDVRMEDSITSTPILSYTSGGGQIAFSSIAAEEGPPAPSFPNAVAWTVPHATSSNLTIATYYHSLWLIDASGNRNLYLKGLYLVLGAQ
jgi:hypothetical protein